MQELLVKVLLVDIDDYSGIIRSVYGLDSKDVQQADLIIDRETGKVLKSRFW